MHLFRHKRVPKLVKNFGAPKFSNQTNHDRIQGAQVLQECTVMFTSKNILTSDSSFNTPKLKECTQMIGLFFMWSWLLDRFIRIISNASDSMCSVQDWWGHTALYLPSSELWKHQTPTHCRLCERMKDPRYWVTFNREMMSPLVTGLVTLLSLAPSVVSIRPYVTCVGCETFMECFLTCPVADYPGVNKWAMSFR